MYIYILFKIEIHNTILYGNFNGFKSGFPSMVLHNYNVSIYFLLL